MKQIKYVPSAIVATIVLLIASYGALSAEAISDLLRSTSVDREGLSDRSISAYLGTATRFRLVECVPSPGGQPSLYVMTVAGRIAVGLPWRTWSYICKVTKANVSHLIACSNVAGALSRQYGIVPTGEFAVRHYESALGRLVASAATGGKRWHPRLPRLHSADMVVKLSSGLFVAFEVERAQKYRPLLFNIVSALLCCPRIERAVYVIPDDAHEVMYEVRRAIKMCSERLKVDPGKILVVSMGDLLSGKVPCLDELFAGNEAKMAATSVLSFPGNQEQSAAAA